MKRRKHKAQQLAFETILDFSFRAHERKLMAYCAENRDKYTEYARAITPDLTDKVAVYSRIAFAILSANAPFEASTQALALAVVHKGTLQAHQIAHLQMIPNKARYVNTLWDSLVHNHTRTLKGPSEPWHDYRLRLQRMYKGLGLAKASFAAALLYPLEADVACVDTWVQKVFCGNRGFRTLGVKQYIGIESRIRAYARQFEISTFLAQWLLWDHARGVTSDHAIFPGAHKDTLREAA